MTLALFFHLAGIIIGLGAVTVIDTLGFLGRTSKRWTRTTIEAHHVTKPLIWLGTVLMIISWLWLYDGSFLAQVKSWLMPVMVLNGCFLSFIISPRLDRLPKDTLLPTKMQAMIAASFAISFTSWWSLVWITAVMLNV